MKKTWNGSCFRARRCSGLYSANRDGASRRGKGCRASNSGRPSNNVIANALKKMAKPQPKRQRIDRYQRRFETVGLMDKIAADPERYARMLKRPVARVA